MRLAGQVAHMGERRGVHRILVGKPEGKSHLEDPGIEGRIILSWIFRKWNVRAWVGFIWFKVGTSGQGVLNAVMNL